MQQFAGKVATRLALEWELSSVRALGRRGSVAFMTASLGVLLIGFSALAVDVSIWEGSASTMQGAADQAALAASLALSSGSPAARQEAKGLAAAYGFIDGVAGVSVAVNIPPATGSYVSSASAIEVVIRQPQSMFLSGGFLTSAIMASARAVAANGPPGAAATVSTCIMALAPTGISVMGAGAAQVDAGTCNVYINSTSACDLNLSGSAVLKGFDIFLGAATTQGCISSSAKLTATSKVNLKAASVADPYANRVMPVPAKSCKTVLPTATTLVPGTYCGLSLNGVQSITLSSGIYIFDGGDVAAAASSKINGNNVTLVLTSSAAAYGQLYVNGAANITLTPMTTGPTAGMAIWLDKKGARPLTVSGSGTLNVTGAIDAPAAAVVWSGAATGPCTQLIASTINFSGSAGFKHSCSGLGVSDPPSASASAASYKLAE